jgi:peptidoglycan L-alanyl-D-glutamate endopeptidase CwlK
MTFYVRSLPKLDGVHPDIVRVILRAAEFYPGDYLVTEGVRSLARQQQLKAAGASQTLRSRHVPESNTCGLSCAVDLAVWLDLDEDGNVENGEIRWDWPLYKTLADAVKEAARVEGVPIEWGGDWKSFRDGPHFQLPWSKYP